MENKANERELFIRIALRALTLIVSVLLAVYVIWPLIKMLSPIVVATLLAAMFSPLLTKAYEKIKIPRKVLALLLVLLFIALLFLPIYYLVKEGLNQAQQIAQEMRNYEPKISPEDAIAENIGALEDILPESWPELLQNVIDKFVQFVRDSSDNVLNSTLDISRKIISQATAITLWLLTFFMSFFFILAEFPRIKDALHAVLTRRTWAKMILLKDSSFKAVGDYVRGTLHLAIICFLFMWLAFSIYGFPYAIIVSLILAIIDFLPIVGAMTVLIPWTAIEFLFGDQKFAMFLLILMSIYLPFRKIIEPKVYGNATGLHPLATLASMYMGLQINGVWGAIIGPIVLMIARSILKTGMFDDWFLDLHEFRSRLRIRLRRKR